MRSFFIGLPQGRGFRPELRKRWLALLATGGVLAGAAIAQNCRPALERAFSRMSQAPPQESVQSPGSAPSERAMRTVPSSRSEGLLARSADCGKMGDPPACEAPQPLAAAPTATASLLSLPVERKPLTLRDALSLAEQSRAALRDVRDYTAVFTKTERINGRLRKQVMEMKLREKPFSVYLLYRSKKEAGRQAIFVAGRDDGKLVVKDVGIRAALGTLQLGLQNPLVTCANRYPVTELVISKVVETALTAWERERNLPETRAVVAISANSRFGDADCCELTVTHQNRIPQIDFQKACLYFDKQTRLPIHVERYGWPEEAGEEPPLMEEYSYSNVKTNVGLTDGDFDPSRYGF